MRRHASLHSTPFLSSSSSSLSLRSWRLHARGFRPLDVSKFNPLPPELTAHKLDVSRLKQPETALPQAFPAERSGEVDLKWLSEAPRHAAALKSGSQLPTPEQFMYAPAHEAADVLATHLAYHELLRLASEHHWVHLLPRAMLSDDAPLPHVLYEDFMKVLTFSSKQDDPLKQFALPPDLLRTLMCRCADLVLVDRAYFTRVEAFFRQIEQQQPAASEVYSAFVMTCIAAGEVDKAVSMLKVMDDQGMAMDPVVFALTMHPGLSAYDVARREFHGKAKGLITQQRIATGMQESTPTASALGVHAAFVHWSITGQKAKKWEILRAAIAQGVRLNDRTLNIVAEAFNAEKGRYCGPRTTKALCTAFATQGRVDRVIAVVGAMRVREAREQTPQLEQTAWSEAEEATLFEMCVASNPNHVRRHEKLLRAVLRNEAPPDVPSQRRVGEPLSSRIITPSASKAAANADADASDDFSAALLARPRSASESPLAATPIEPQNSAAVATGRGLVMQEGGDAVQTSSPQDEKANDDASSPWQVALVATTEGKGGDTALRRSSSTSGASKRSKRRGFRARRPAAMPSVVVPAHVEGAARPADGRVGVVGSTRETATMQVKLAESTKGTVYSADHDNAVAFKEAVAARAAQLAEIDSIVKRLSTAWMNPDSEYN